MTDEELIARLRKFPNGRFEHTGAADRIEALVKEKAAAYAQGYGDCEAETSLTEIGRTNEFLHGQIAKWKARLDAVKDKAEAHIIDLMAERDRAEARAKRLEEALRKLACKCPSNCDWEHDDICPSWTARAALEGGAA